MAQDDRIERRIKGALELLGQFSGWGDRSTLSRAMAELTKLTERGLNDVDERIAVFGGLGAAAWQTYLLTRDPADLDLSVRSIETALELQPPQSAARRVHLSNLAGALRTRYEDFGDVEALAAAIEHLRVALALMPAETPDPQLLANLGGALLKWHEVRPGGALLDEALSLRRRALECLEQEGPERASFISRYAEVLLARFRHLKNPADLHDAIEHATQAVQTVGPGQPESVLLATRLWNTLVEVQIESLAELDQLIDGFRLALMRVPAGASVRPQLLEGVLRAELARQNHAPRESGPRTLVEDYKRLAEVQPPGDEQRLGLLVIAAELCMGWVRDSGDPEMLGEAVDLYRQVTTETSTGHPDRCTLFSHLGVALQLRAQAKNDPADLNEAIAAATVALESADPDHPERADFFTRLGLAHHDRYERREDIMDLNVALRYERDALSMTDEHDPALAGRRSNLAASLLMRFGATGRDEDLNEAVELSRAAAAGALGHPREALYLINLAGALLTRIRHAATDDVADAVEAAARGMRCAVDPADRVMAAAQYGAALTARFEQSQELPDIETAIDVLREAVTASAGGSVQHTKILGLLRDALSARHRRTGDVAHLREAVEALRDQLFLRFGRVDDLEGAVRGWLESTERQSADRPGLWETLVLALEGWREYTLQPMVLRMIVTFRRQTVALTAETDPRWPDRAAGLAGVLRVWFEVNGDPADLNEAIDLGRRALDITEDIAVRGELLTDLGTALLTRDAHGNVAEDLEEAFRVLDLALEVVPADTPERQRVIFERAVACKIRYERSGFPLDADYAIGAFESSAAQSPKGSAEHITALINLAGILAARAQKTDALSDPSPDADLRIAGERSREALEFTPSGHPLRYKTLSARAILLTLRIGKTCDPDALAELQLLNLDLTAEQGQHQAGRMSELIPSLQSAFQLTHDRGIADAAIIAGRTAIETIPADHPTYPLLMANLALSLHARFERVGDPVDADDAIEFIQRAIAAEPHQGRHKNVLAMVLFERYRHTGGRADLEGAIAAGRDALMADMRPGEKYAAMSNLAHALDTRFDLTGAEADLDEAATLAAEAAAESANPGVLNNLALIHSSRFAITGDLEHATAAIKAFEGALERTSAGGATRPGLLSNIGNLHRHRHRVTGDGHDLDLAIRYYEDTVETIPPDHSDRAMYLVNLGHARAARGSEADLKTGLDAFREATRCSMAPVSIRVEAGEAWGRHAANAGNWAEAVSGYSTAIGLLPRLASRSLNRADQERHLSRTSGLASAAAAAAIQNDDPEQAVLLLERGRGVLFAQVLDTRSDLTDLGTDHPELAAELLKLQERLDPIQSGEMTWEANQQRRRDAARWDELVDRARDLPGHRSFLQPLSIWELTDEAVNGPLVYVNVTAYRTDALIVTPEGVSVVPLPGVSADALAERSRLYFDVLLTEVTSSELLLASNEEVTRMLSFLWDTIVSPVLAALGWDRTPGPEDSLPRLWWLPVGWVSLLPLHAAGYHNGSGQSALDRIVSSYIPTVRALRHGRRRSAVHAQGGAIAVAMSRTPDANDLPCAHAEARLVAGTIANTLVLRNEQATRERVLAELPRHPWAHFVCHGAPDMADPSAGCLVVHDHRDQPLTVLDIGNLWMRQARLAFLSACMTAAAPPALGDEAIHLAAACYLAGYPHVIAAVWPVWDQAALKFTERCYAHLGRNGEAAMASDIAIATAAHEAARDLRNAYPNLPTLWAPHIHTGI